MSYQHYVQINNESTAHHVLPQGTDDTKPTSRHFYIVCASGLKIFVIWLILNWIIQSKWSFTYGSSVVSTALSLSSYMFMIQGALFGIGIVMAWWADVSGHWGTYFVTCIYNLMCVMVYLMDVEPKAGFHVWKQDTFPQCFSSPRLDALYDATVCHSYIAATLCSLFITLFHATWCCLHASWLLKHRSTISHIIRNPFPCISLILGCLNLSLFFVTMVIMIYLKPYPAIYATSADSLMFMAYAIIITLSLLYHSYEPSLRNTFFTLCWCILTMGYVWSDFAIIQLKEWKSEHDRGWHTDFALQAWYVVNTLFAIFHTIATCILIIQFILKLRNSSGVEVGVGFQPTH